MPVAVGGALAEALYTTLVSRFAALDQSRASFAQAVRLSTWISLALMSVLVMVIVAIDPTRIGVWLILACVIPPLAVGGACSAFLVARHRYLAAVARVPIATGLALAISCAILLVVRSPIALAGGMAAGYFIALVVLLLIAGREPAGFATRDGLPALPVARSSGSVFIAVLIGGPLVVVVERALASGLPWVR